MSSAILHARCFPLGILGILALGLATSVRAASPGAATPPASQWDHHGHRATLRPDAPRHTPPVAARRSHVSAPESHVRAANLAARVEPAPAAFDNAIQRYAYSDGALFQIYTKPDEVTDIALQPGETLVGSGPVAAGDTVRWIIGDTYSGSGTTKRTHILVKPTRPDIATNLVINTDRRTYHLELRANPAVYMASVSWIYPQDQLIAIRQVKDDDEKAAPVVQGIPLDHLNFDYRIAGDKPAWRPVRVFDDGTRTMVEFPSNIAQFEMPPLFVTGPSKEAELVNYRVEGRFLVVDRLFAAAELRLGTGRHAVRVTIVNRARSQK